MKLRMVLGLGFLGLTVLAASAETPRPYITKENRLPEVRQLELGLSTDFRETEISDTEDLSTWTFTPAARYGLAPELAVTLEVPGVRREIGDDDTENGLGDIQLGLEFLAWEDIFHYPYILPYLEVGLPTGDEDKGLGNGDATANIGLAFGTTVYETLSYALDLGYRFLQDEGNVFAARGALIYDLSKQTSVLVEGEFEEAHNGEEDDRVLVLGGLTYKPAPKWFLGLYGGARLDGEEDDPVVAAKLMYTFKAFAPR